MASRMRFPALGSCLMGALLAAPAWSQPVHPTPAPFLDVRWGSTLDSVRSAAALAGLDYLRVDEDGDHAFRGVIAGVPAVVFATFGDSGLTRVVVSWDPHPTVASTFERLRDTLSTRFGKAVLATDRDGPWRPAAGLFVASAWRGILMGLRRDGRVLMVFTCPAASPKLPNVATGLVASVN